jgi:hypothetical protein
MLTHEIAQDHLSSIETLKRDMDQISHLWTIITQWTPVRIVYDTLYRMFLFFIVMPLFYVYVNGPSIYGVGFWRGKSFPDICSSVTSVQASFWTESQVNASECEMIVLREFTSILVGFSAAVYLVGLIIVSCWLMSRLSRYTRQAFQGIVQDIQTEGALFREVLARNQNEAIEK